MFTRHKPKVGIDSDELLDKRVMRTRTVSRERRLDFLSSRRAVVKTTPVVEHLLEKSSEIILDVRSCSVSSCKESLAELRALLESGDESVLQETVHLGLVTRLASFVDNGDVYVQLDALRCLTNLAAGSTVVAREVLRVLTSICMALTRSSLVVQEQAVWCLGNLAGDAPEFIEVLLLHDVHNMIFKALPPGSQSLDPPLRPDFINFRRLILWAMGNLVRGPCADDPSPFINILPAAFAGLADQSSISESAWLFAGITHVWKDLQSLHYDLFSGMIALFNREEYQTLLLDSLAFCSTKPSLTPLLKTVHFLILASPAFASTMFKAETFRITQICFSIINTHTDNSSRLEALTVLAAFAAGRDVSPLLLDTNILDVLQMVLESGSFDVKKEATAVVSNLSFYNPIAIAQSRLLPLFVPLLRSKDVELQSWILICLSNILVEHPDSALKIAEANLVPALINLSESADSHMASQASYLLDAYLENFLPQD
ncbi:hypothetical protein RCL1_001630 [Eukaryota sp. TZLM3-RCL]